MIDVSICAVNSLGESKCEGAALSPFFTIEGVNLLLQITTEDRQMT